MKGYLVSGLPPGPSGLGRFLSMLIPLAKKNGWKVLYRPSSRGRGKIAHGLDLVKFYLQLRSIRNERILVFHPQTLKWSCFFRLSGRNQVIYFVVDNSFFCIRSYNYRGQEWCECTECLSHPEKCHASCQPFPVRYDRSENLRYLKKLMEAAPEITFLVQNSNQGRLVSEHFGPDVKVQRVGMLTDEFEAASRGKPGSGEFDVVFHGAVHAAKGAGYAISLARHLPELSFLLPGRLDKVVSFSGSEGVPENITVRDITWETGLREAVENCSVVLCPSLWSAPIEGALIKSILHNGRVAVFDTRFGYQAELPDDLVIRLGPDMEDSARKIREELLHQFNKGRIDTWYREFLDRTDLESVFL